MTRSRSGPVGMVASDARAMWVCEAHTCWPVIGLGMGAAFGILYDIAIGDIDPAEAGSASGSLGSVQQLANAPGPAVVTTIYFGALAGGQAHAMSARRGECPGRPAATCKVQGVQADALP